MVKNIVFDMGNVLIKFSPKELVRKYIQNEAVVDLLVTEIFRSKEWIQYDRGVITLDGVISAAKERVPYEYHNLIQSVVDNWYAELPAYADMEVFISELKSRGYKIYLLSNAGKSFYNFREKIPALKNFDGEFISADYKLLKPEKEIYLEFYKQFDLVAEECFFIDDLSINIESAERTGMKGFVYHGDITKLRTNMENLGILK